MRPMSRYSQFFFTLIVILIGAESGAAIDWAFEDSMLEIVDQINEGSGQAFADALDIGGL